MAVEFSTEAASLALLEDGEVRAAAAVDAGGRRSQGIFAAAEGMLGEAGWEFGDIEAYAVGRGPGAYTGLRVGLTAARGWALPRNRPTWATSSAAARAAEVFAARKELERFVAWGPSRKGTIWAGLYVRDGAIPRREGDWALMPVGERGTIWAEAAWDEPGMAPKAEWVGRLHHLGAAGEEMRPIYLHPAVAAAPRYDAAGRAIGD